MHISLISSSSKMTTLGKTLQTDIYNALSPSRENREVDKQVQKDTQKGRTV